MFCCGFAFLATAPYHALAMRLLPPAWLKHKAAFAVGAVLIAALLASAVWAERGLTRLWRMQAQLGQMESEAIQLQHDNRQLREHLRRLRTDAAYAERVVRQRLGWVRDGEILYRVPRRDSK